ncbi:MAG: ABC-F family ATP-binding cassette domain-containing protein [Treponema sp.]|nr:ABC-F family ATP-binding cassette domain-containing protein [Treponema sp.]
MAFVQFSKVSLAFGDRDILKEVSVNLQAGTKAALTGANGTGKSTLIKVMAGLMQPDSGNRVAQKDARIAYLPQSGLTHRGCTLKEEADKAFQFGYEMQEKIDELGERLKTNATDAIIEEQSRLIQALDDSGWHRREATAESVLIGLGFSREDFGRNTEEFSGGWQMRIALAKALMQNPDILLLDEPTNYLDLEARNWLEGFLKDFQGGFLLVSHDRYFLDVTINEVYELFNGELKQYSGNFTHYEKVREQELVTLMHEYEKQQEEIAHLQEFIDRFRYKATKAVAAQERIKMLDKIMEHKIEIPESLKKIHFKFPAAPHAGRLVLRLNGITKSYDGSEKILDNLDLTLENGERLVVAGRNGAGKSTLLRIIAGEDKNFTGEIVPGAGVQMGYFSQDNAEKIKGSMTILDYLESEAPLELIPKLRDMLGAFLFRGDDVYKSLDVLSGGEKSRVALLLLLLKPINLLILDEPTNHLDMHSKDVLLQAMMDFGGTVIFVSHDRGFIEGAATKVLELKHGEYKYFPGDYGYYLEQIEKIENGQLIMDNKVSTAGKNPGKSEIVNNSQLSTANSQLSWEEQKKLEAAKRKKEKALAECENKIAELEEKKAEYENQMANPEVYSNGEKAKAVQAKIDEITAQISEWEEKWAEFAE